MRPAVLLPLLLCAITPAHCQNHPLGSAHATPEERRAAEFVARAEEELLRDTQKATIVAWAYYTNITDHNEKARLEYQVRMCNQTMRKYFF